MTTLFIELPDYHHAAAAKQHDLQRGDQWRRQPAAGRCDRSCHAGQVATTRLRAIRGDAGDERINVSFAVRVHISHRVIAFADAEVSEMGASTLPGPCVRSRPSGIMQAVCFARRLAPRHRRASNDVQIRSRVHEPERPVTRRGPRTIARYRGHCPAIGRDDDLEPTLPAGYW